MRRVVDEILSKGGRGRKVSISGRGDGEVVSREK